MADCNELIVSEDAYDYIVRVNSELYNKLKDDEKACIRCVGRNWCLAYKSADTYNQVSSIEEGYYTIPKLYGLMDTTSFDASGISSVLNQSLLNVKGQGVIIGFIDTGIDYTLENFQSARNRSRIMAIWDQTIQQADYSEDALKGEFYQERRQLEKSAGAYDYGTVYTRNEINNALEAASNGDDPYSKVPSKDEYGHGTFIAGVAASSSVDSYRGGAPESDILVVKLKPAKRYLRDYFFVKDGAVAYEESDIINGVRFLQYYAENENKPLVICIGLGTGSGPRNGATPLADILSAAAGKINTVVVSCMGNEANSRNHTEGIAVSDNLSSEIEINVGEKSNGFIMELWAETQDVLSISIGSPSGEVIPRIPARVGSSSVFKFILDNTTVTVDYKIVETISGYEVIFVRFITPAAGIWKIDVYSLTNIAGRYNAWLPLKQFMKEDTFFLNSTPDITLTEPSAEGREISVAAYDHITGAAYIESGRGFTTDNKIKPDIAAPGVNVYGPLPGGKYTYRSGTSIAAAHVAAAAALLLSWGVYYKNAPLLGNNEVKAILIRGAYRQPDIVYPDRVWGYGRMSLIDSFYQLRVV